MTEPGFRFEHELTESFHKHATPSLWTRSDSGKWLSTKESTCSEGRADLVWGKFAPNWPRERVRVSSDILQNPTASRILAAFHRSPRPRSERDLQSPLGVTTAVLRKHLTALVAAGLVKKTHDERFRAISLRGIAPLEICSFELKLTDWRRALYQATRYRSFSNRVFVVMPPQGASVALKHRSAFQQANIGLVSHESSGHSRILIRPEKRVAYARFRTIMAVGMFGSPTAKLRRSV